MVKREVMAMVKTSKFMTKSASFVQRVSCQTTLGIGLALMQELAKLHGGAVRAESIYGKGSRPSKTSRMLGRLPGLCQ